MGNSGSQVYYSAAKNLGIEIITGFVGSPIWPYWYSFPQTSEEIIEEGFQTIVKRWTPLFDEMDKNGLKFALEVHPTEIAFDYYTFVRLLKSFNYRKTLGMNFDPSHLFWQGIKPHLMIRELPDRIYHVHIKDASVTLDGLTGILGSISSSVKPGEAGISVPRPWRCRFFSHYP